MPISRPSIIWSLALISSIAFGDTLDVTNKNYQSVDSTEIKKIYDAFLYEKELCVKIAENLAQDPGLLRKLENPSLVSDVGISNLLKSSKVASAEVIQYLIKHIDYFVIYEDFHGISKSAVNIQGSAVFCAQSGKRLTEIEDHGPSELAWRLQEELLNALIKGLYIPDPLFTDEITGRSQFVGGVPFTYLETAFEEAKKFYKDAIYKKHLKILLGRANEKIRNAISELESKSDAVLAEELTANLKHPFSLEHVRISEIQAHQAKKEHIELLKGWISRLTDLEK